MPEWLTNMLAAVGGGAVVLVGVLTIFKKLFIKLFDTGIETAFGKNLEKYRNQLSRSARAYEILLDREMRFYGRMEPIFAELVPLVQDLLYNAKRDTEIERTAKFEAFRTCFKRYTELIIELKNETLVHQLYIPQNVFAASTAVVSQIQEDLPRWLDVGRTLFDGEYEKIDYEKGQEAVDKVLLCVVKNQLEIKKRLEELCKLS